MYKNFSKEKSDENGFISVGVVCILIIILLFFLTTSKSSSKIQSPNQKPQSPNLSESGNLNPGLSEPFFYPVQSVLSKKNGSGDFQSESQQGEIAIVKGFGFSLTDKIEFRDSSGNFPAEIISCSSVCIKIRIPQAPPGIYKIFFNGREMPVEFLIKEPISNIKIFRCEEYVRLGSTLRIEGQNLCDGLKVLQNGKEFENGNILFGNSGTFQSVSIIVRDAEIGKMSLTLKNNFGEKTIYFEVVEKISEANKKPKNPPSESWFAKKQLFIQLTEKENKN